MGVGLHRPRCKDRCAYGDAIPSDDGAQVVSTMIVAPLGNFAIAANSFAVTAESLCYMPGYGIAEAATTLVGQSVGAKRKELCKSFAYMTIFIGYGSYGVYGRGYVYLRSRMIGMLSPVPEIRELGVAVLRIEAFAEPFFAAAIVLIAYVLVLATRSNHR